MYVRCHGYWRVHFSVTPPTPWAILAGSSLTLLVISPKFPGSSENTANKTICGVSLVKREEKPTQEFRNGYHFDKTRNTSV